MRRIALVVCLVAGLLACSAGSALALPHAKRHAKAKACKPRKPAARSSTVARPTPIRAGETRRRAAIKRSKAKRRRCAKAKRKTSRRRAQPGTPSAPAATQPGSTSTPATPGSPTPEPGGDPTAPLPPSNPFAVQVRSGEFFLQLSKPEVNAGNVRVEFNNSTAEDPHDLHLVRADGTGAGYAFGELQSGEVEAKTVALNAGSWRLFCGLPDHAERGMSANLRVAGG